ncbi:MAG: phosphodiesterase/alkaline phosphatase D-like protein [Rhodothermales bacterium]|jgi:phosphodiesterase/alkaline phosphatase D-like protein
MWRSILVAILMAGAAGAVTVQVPLQPGWNLLSVPVDVSSQTVAQLFGNVASGTIWGWEEARLVELDRLQPGQACWVYRQPELGPAAVNVSGDLVEQVFRPVDSGWNLIGPLGYPPVADLYWPLISEPRKLILGGPWRHDEAGFSGPESLAAGEGAWVFAARNGLLRLSGHPIMGPVLASSSAFGTLAVGWDAANDDHTRSAAMRYEVYGATSANNLVSAGNLLGEASGASFTKGSLSPGAIYYVAVVARDGEGNKSGFARVLPITLLSVAPNVLALPKDLATMNVQITNLAADASSFTVSGPDATQITNGDLIVVDSHLRRVLTNVAGDVITEAVILGDVLRDGQVRGSIAISADAIGPQELAAGIDFDGELRFQPNLRFEANLANGLLSSWSARMAGALSIDGKLAIDLPGGTAINSETVLREQVQDFSLTVGGLSIPTRVTFQWVAEVVASADSTGRVDADFAITAPLDATITYSGGFGFETSGSNTASMAKPVWTLRKGGNLDVAITVSPRLRLAMFADELADFAFRPTLALDTIFENQPLEIGFTEVDLLLQSDYQLASDIAGLRSGTAPWTVPVGIASTRILGSPLITMPSAEFATAPDTLYLTEPGVFDLTVTNGVGNTVPAANITWRVEGEGAAVGVALSNGNRRATLTVPDLGIYTLIASVTGSGLPAPMGTRTVKTRFIATHIPFRFLGATRIDDTTVDLQFSEPADPDALGEFDLVGTPILTRTLMDDGSRIRLRTHYLFGYANAATATGTLNFGGRGLVEPLTQSFSPTSLAPTWRSTFDSGGLPGNWQVVDDPLATTSAPSAWGVESGSLRHTSLIRGGGSERYDIEKPGTYFLYNTSLTDCMVEARFRNFTSSSMGLIARYQTTDSYYRFEWSGGDDNPANPQIDGVRRLVKVTPTGSIELASDRQAFFRGVDTDVRFLVMGSRLSVFVDDELVMQAADTDYASGRVGVYAWGNNGLEVDSLVVAVPGTPLSYTDTSSEQRPTAPSMHHGTMLSELSSDSAIAWARSSEAADVRVRYSTLADLSVAIVTAPVRTAAIRDFSAHIPIDNLSPDTVYYARTEVLDLARPSQINYSPVREFRTPAASGPMDFSVVLFGDIGLSDTPRYRAFGSLANEHADYLFSLGDFPYADHVPAAKTATEFMQKHAHSRGLPRMRKLLNQTPIWGLWDDHEVTNDWDGEKSRQLVGNGLQAWHTWWPLRRDPGYIRPPTDHLDTTEAFRFDIEDSVLRTSQGFPEWGQKASVSFWFKWRDTNSNDPFFRAGPAASWIALFQDSLFKFKCKVYTSVTDYTFFSGSGWADDAWHHALFQVDMDAQLATLYLDGIKAVSKVVEGELRQPTDFIEFGSSAGGQDALIDEIAIYDHVDLEPWQFHNDDGSPRPPPAGMKMWWRAEAMDFPTAVDQSGNGIDAVASGVEAETFVEASTHILDRSPRAVPNYRKQRFGDTAEVFFLDTRFYRDRNHAPDDGTKTMLGTEQFAWLLDGLSASTAHFKIIVTSVALRYGTTPNDYWAGFVRERELIVDHIVANNIKVFFLSGDQHWHAVYTHAEGFIEVQTSSITAGSRGPASVPSDRFAYIQEILGYSRLDIFGSSDPRIEIQMKDVAGNLLYSHTVR